MVRNYKRKGGPQRGKPFVKGDLRIKTISDRLEASGVVLEAAERSLDVQADLEHVYLQPKSKDKTPGQRSMRRIWEKYPERVLKELRAGLPVEKKEGSSAVAEVEEEDEGVEKVNGLIDRLLGEWEDVARAGPSGAGGKSQVPAVRVGEGEG